ncbi:MAG: hypothetical protein ACI8VC_002771 [Candidatus Endobugula sp.]|jgi:hypothetical protein
MRRLWSIKRKAVSHQRPATVSRVLLPRYLFGLLSLMYCVASLAEMRNVPSIDSPSLLPDFYFDSGDQCTQRDTIYNNFFNSTPCVSSGKVYGQILLNHHSTISVLEEIISSPLSSTLVPGYFGELFEPDIVNIHRPQNPPSFSGPMAFYGWYHFLRHGGIRPFAKIGGDVLHQNYRIAARSASFIINHEYAKTVANCAVTCMGSFFAYNYLDEMFPFAESFIPGRVDIFGFVQDNRPTPPWDQLPWINLAGNHRFQFQANNALQHVLPQENIDNIFIFLFLNGEDIEDPDEF